MSKVEGQVGFLIARFPECLKAYDRDCPFTKYGQLEHHMATIELRRKLRTARAAVNNPSFRWNLYKTLKAWQIGTRGSKLKRFEAFEEALCAKIEEIQALDGLMIDNRDLDAQAIGERLAELVQSLDIVENKARVVPGSKTLHHILPDLVVPIDRAYTQEFFEWPTPRFQNYPKKFFVESFTAFNKIALATNPVQYVGRGWYTSRSKVLDNAVVGFWCLAKAEVMKSRGQIETNCSGSGTCDSAGTATF